MSKGNLADFANQQLIGKVKEDLTFEMSNHNFKPNKRKSMEVEEDNSSYKIVVPQNVNKLQAAYDLLKQFEEEETVRNYNRNYAHFFMNDFMVAMGIIIKKYFGMLHVSPVNTDGKKAGNDYIQIPIGYDTAGKLQTEQGYVGSILAPCWEDAIIDIYPQGNVIVKAKLKFEKNINTFLKEIEDAIRAHSVVMRGAVTVAEVRGGMMAHPINPKENKKIILDESTERVVANIIIPSMGDRGKNSLLFTGDFGTGKTETAIRVGLAGRQQFGRTFFYLHNASLFGILIPYLKNYQACTVFVEDVDQISAGDRDSNMNDLLNQLDGNELKNVDATFIFTTNNHDKIHPSMRRPGRIDQVVHFDYCTPEVIGKIFTLYAAGLEGADSVDYAAAAAKCPEQLQGAVVAEISRRAVKYATKQHNGVISTDVFLDAVASMEHHVRFMREDQKKDHSVEELLGHMLFRGMTKAFPAMEHGDFSGSKYAGLDN